MNKTVTVSTADGRDYTETYDKLLLSPGNGRRGAAADERCCCRGNDDGGGALLRGLEELIEEKTGINTMTAEQPMTCVAIGTGKYVEFLSGKRDEEI